MTRKLLLKAHCNNPKWEIKNSSRLTVRVKAPFFFDKSIQIIFRCLEILTWRGLVRNALILFTNAWQSWEQKIRFNCVPDPLKLDTGMEK